MKMADVEASKSKDSHEEEERKTIISRVMNMDVKVDKGGTRATVVLPGLSYDDFDRTDNITMWSIGKKFEVARYAAMKGSFLDGDKLLQELINFVVAGTFDISKELYRYVRANHSTRNLTFQFDFVTYGNSSTDVKSTWYRMEDGQSLATLIAKFVVVNRATRKASPLPDWFKAKYKKTSNQDGFKWLQPLEVPADAFKYDKVVEHSDTDQNKHASHFFYLKTCFDAAATACYAGYYKQYQGDFFEYLTQKMWVLYSKESIAGDTVTVYTWEEPGQVDKVYFQIKRDGDALFHSVLQVHKVHKDTKFKNQL